MLGIMGWLAIGVAALGLGACSGAPATAVKEPVKLRLRVVASEGVNPNEWGVASPVLVRIYELKSAAAFSNADFFTLQDHDRKAIGDDVLAIDEFILRPGEERDIERESHRAATAIGVLAGYRELGKSVWRGIYRLPPRPDAAWYRITIPVQRQNLTVRLGRRAVSIYQSDQSR
ncbi:type VI secretion system lipoprotein TssJ [Burkholderia glumae]|uniref:type VI secretion system lipoprotein TssJ n=1 Tax=Burkholderia glumae TaxID=337 RepID=UPI001F51D6DE|nr:type VI secretion system lipoprotein TssJ [Burkholderia glumae]MCM2494418.1 type VI secretion system lipoprotein TssJ [Burkholderia glumae]